MKKWLLLTCVLILMAVTACRGATLTSAGSVQPPKVTLERVEVASYFPWAAYPALPSGTPALPAIRVPLILAFIFNVENPNSFNVMLDSMKFTVAFEAKSGQFFEVNTPMAYERMYIPPGKTNQVRIVSVLDSAVVPGNLAVTSGSRLKDLGLSGGNVVKAWWENIGDFSFGIQATQGLAEFTSDRGNAIATFSGTFGSGLK